MHLSKMQIENFRSIKNETLDFNDYTVLVGPNGSGKSTVLTALDILFRNTPSDTVNVHSLGAEDFHLMITDNPIKIIVTFSDLDEAAKEDFRHYIRQEELTILAKAEWDPISESADVYQYGSRRVIKDFSPYFKANREGVYVAELKEIYNGIREQYPDLPSETVKGRMEDALRDYEETHPDLTKSVEAEDQFYGWSKGTNLLAKYIQWVHIPAVKDASSEQIEGRTTALGQLLERTIRAKIDFSEPIEKIRASIASEYRALLEDKQKTLSELSDALQQRLREWSSPRSRLELNWRYDRDSSIRISEPNAEARVGEEEFIGDVSRLGHGLQRLFIVALLQELAATVSEGPVPSLLLGIEEPELYQHPPQVRFLARALEEMSDNDSQVIVTTHSPLFVVGRGFENIRMFRKSGRPASTVISSLTYEQLDEILSAALGEKPQSPSNRMASVHRIMQPSQNEMFFATSLILVEGIEDIAFISTQIELREEWKEFRKLGCHFVVGEGKTSLSRLLAIAKALGIPCFVVFDADTDKEDAKRQARDNMCILRLCNLEDADSLPTEVIWEREVVVWPSRIADVIKEEISPETWLEVQAAARDAYDFSSDVSSKNPLLISAIMEILSERGIRSAILDKLVNSILTFAEDARSAKGSLAS